VGVKVGIFVGVEVGVATNENNTFQLKFENNTFQLKFKFIKVYSSIICGS